MTSLLFELRDAVRGLLDGHTWLSRKLATRNHYPAIDLLESIPDGFCAFDRNWRYTYINPAGARMTSPCRNFVLKAVARMVRRKIPNQGRPPGWHIHSQHHARLASR